MKQLISFGLSLCLGLGFVACSSDSSSGNGGGNSPADVVGEWTGTASDTAFVYTFNSGGTGIYTETHVVSKADGSASTTLLFNYTKSSSTEGTIEFASSSKLTATFTISGKSMTVKRSDGLTQSVAKTSTTNTNNNSGSGDTTNPSGGQGNGALTINGITFSVTHGFFFEGDGDLLMYFYNCDMPTLMKTRDVSKLPDNVNMIVICVYGAGQNTTMPTGTFNEFTVLTGTTTKQQLASSGSFGTQYTNYGEFASGNITISKSGSNYIVKFGAMDYENPMAGNDHTRYKGSAFSFNGGFSYYNMGDVK